MRALEVFRPRPVAASLRAQLVGALRRAVVCCLLLAAPVVAAYALTPATFGVGEMEFAAPERGAVVAEAVDRDAARAASLVERHGCWTGDAPAGAIPGGVVLQERGELPRYYSADAVVGGALDHLFVSADPVIVAVFGFCP